MAENFALRQEEYEAEKALYDLEVTKRQLIADIHGKNSERAWRVDQVANDVSRFILLNPEETILHLCHTFGSLVPEQKDAQDGMPVLGATSATDPTSLK